MLKIDIIFYDCSGILHVGSTSLLQSARSRATQLASALSWRQFLLVLFCLGLIGAMWPKSHSGRYFWESGPPEKIAPLAMVGGNPYLRALMRTISASEAYDPSPYTLLYGGKHVQDLSEHPDRCIPIRFGLNRKKCSTAAGRYQFLTTTWQEKAAFYHPNPSGWLFWQRYSFVPEYQDQVVYAWLNDPYAWKMDIPKRLENGELEVVLERLSGTWTSLGYGIEDNKITPYLAQIYEQMLAEELNAASSSKQ